MVGLLGRVISLSQGLCLHRTTAKKDEDKHPCLKQDLNPQSSVRVLKARASHRAATGSALVNLLMNNFLINDVWIKLNAEITSSLTCYII
jgi:hypothetical protein